MAIHISLVECLKQLRAGLLFQIIFRLRVEEFSSCWNERNCYEPFENETASKISAVEHVVQAAILIVTEAPYRKL